MHEVQVPKIDVNDEYVTVVVWHVENHSKVKKGQVVCTLETSKASWDVNVIEPGEYLVELNYAGSGRLVWSVESDEGKKVQNQQNSSHIFINYPMGWMRFDKAGKHIVSVSLVEGDSITSELAAIRFTAIDFGDQEKETVQISRNK